MENVLNHNLAFPSTMVDDDENTLKDVISQLLQPDPEERIGMNGL